MIPTALKCHFRQKISSYDSSKVDRRSAL